MWRRPRFIIAKSDVRGVIAETKMDKTAGDKFLKIAGMKNPHPRWMHDVLLHDLTKTETEIPVGVTNVLLG